MFKNILVTTDLSEASTQAIPMATELARTFGSTLHLVHVVEDINNYAHYVYSGLPIDSGEFFEGLYQERLRDLTVYATGMKGEMDHPVEDGAPGGALQLAKIIDGMAKGLTVKSHLKRGVPASEIIETAKEIEADLVVISTHGRTGLSHLLLGSVAERVARECPVPVLTVRVK